MGELMKEIGSGSSGESAEETAQYLTLYVSEEQHAIGILDVKEIIELLRLEDERTRRNLVRHYRQSP